MTIKETYETQLKSLRNRKKARNPIHWKTKNSFEDVQKFEDVRMREPLKKEGKGVKRETIISQINQVKAVHKEFPLVRFYDFNNQAEIYQKNIFTDDEDYERCSRTPDGYYFHKDAGIFLIEIENYSRVNDERIDDYTLWWINNFDWIEYIPLIIMEFNRFGNFQRDICKESFDKRSSIEILKEANDTTN